jgi:hypothetical protein
VRIWSLHPRYLDRQGLTACWREALLAQAVLADRTRGYRAHPQLRRFRSAADPTGAVCWYLHGIADEADARSFRFDRSRIDRPAIPVPPLNVTTGQLDYEWSWLRQKLADRSPEVLARWEVVLRPEPHPSFVAVDGPVEAWERTGSPRPP